MVDLVFEGEVMRARRGESLAAALSAAGQLRLRSTAKGAGRGLFCGMGVCQDCLVDVDGERNLRACMTKVERPVEVRRAGGHGAPHAPRAQPPHVLLDSVREATPDVFVIGAGPAGLSAAIAARRAGARVVLADERSRPGGQYFKQAASGEPIDDQQAQGARLARAALAAGVEIWSETLVWGAFEPLHFAATRGGGTVTIRPRTAVYAGGAYERPWAVPGWTLPGVMTTGAAQTLWRTDRRLAGKRVLIAGNGPLNLQVATELAAGGAEIVAVVEAAAPPRSPAAAARMAAAAPGLLAQGLRYLFACRRAGTPIHYGSHVAAVTETPGGLAATVKGAKEAILEADVVCLGYGFLPSNELLRAIGARHDFDADARHLVVKRDGDGATSVAGLFAAGDCAGLGGARRAMAEGTIAGAAAAKKAGFDAPEAVRHAVARARRATERHRRFQAALWSLYAPTLRDAPFTPETLICRCEEVTFGEALAAMDEGLGTVGPIKRRTRIGMGRCQGRYCGWLLSALVAPDGRADEYTGFAPRLPVKPVRIGSLSATPADE